MAPQRSNKHVDVRNGRTDDESTQLLVIHPVQTFARYKNRKVAMQNC